MSNRARIILQIVNVLVWLIVAAFVVAVIARMSGLQYPGRGF